MKAVKKFHSQPERRKHRVSIMLNDSEKRALMRNILKRFEKDSPTLFD